MYNRSPPPPLRLFVSIGLVQRWDKSKVLVSGLQGRARHTFAISLLLLQFFTHPMCSQLDV